MGKQQQQAWRDMPVQIATDVGVLGGSAPWGVQGNGAFTQSCLQAWARRGADASAMWVALLWQAAVYRDRIAVESDLKAWPGNLQ